MAKLKINSYAFGILEQSFIQHYQSAIFHNFNLFILSHIRQFLIFSFHIKYNPWCSQTKYVFIIFNLITRAQIHCYGVWYYP